MQVQTAYISIRENNIIKLTHYRLRTLALYETIAQYIQAKQLYVLSKLN